MKIAKSLVILAGVMMFPLDHTAAQKTDPTAEIRAARAILLASKPGDENIGKAVMGIAHALTSIAESDSGLPGDFRASIRAADARFRHGSFLDEQGIRALNEAYRALNGGKGFAFPETVTSVGEASRLARQRVDEGLKAVEARETRRAASALLDFLLLVTTPKEQ